jgi:putative glutamine amidotransferase
MPVIGITPCQLLPDYLESIRRAGGEPLVLQLTGTPSLQGLDGVMLTGGGDVAPSYYHETPHPKANPPNATRDAFELELAKLSLGNDLPMFGVCRGLQVLNVAAGGTLIQDIPSEVNQALGHEVNSPLNAIAHEIWITRGSDLSRTMQEQLVDGDVLQVNSRHHQAIKRPGTGFEVSATAPDGVIEAIERPGARFCLAVQWHPENFWRTGEFRALFEEFVSVCGNLK